jgi:hypothetical protein
MNSLKLSGRADLSNYIYICSNSSNFLNTFTFPHGIVKLQLDGLHLVKGVVAGNGRSLWALGYTIGFPEWCC